MDGGIRGYVQIDMTSVASAAMDLMLCMIFDFWIYRRPPPSPFCSVLLSNIVHSAGGFGML